MIVSEKYSAIDLDIELLNQHKDEWANQSISFRIALLQEVLQNLKQYAPQLVKITLENQKIDENSVYASEAWGGAVWAIAATVRGYMHTLSLLQKGKDIEFKTSSRANGQLKLHVYPNNIIESALLSGIKEEVWMQPEVNRDNLNKYVAKAYKNKNKKGKVSLVLGAGNVIGIPVLDTIFKLIVDNEVVILKMNPVNAYATKIIKSILEPFIRRSYLQIYDGDEDLGQYLSKHQDIDSILLTGSLNTYEKIVYGNGKDAKYRKELDQPVNQKPFLSELGGVAPVIVLPGKWSKADLKYQAENVVSMKMYNDGFICVSAQILILPDSWEQKEEFLQEIKNVLKNLPPRHAYYPGARQRYTDAIQNRSKKETFNGDVPATLIYDLDPENEDEYLFNHEVFAPVYGIVQLNGESIYDYLETAVSFCNNRLKGTLGASIIGHPQSIKSLGVNLEIALEKMRYGSIGINVWNCMAYLLPYTPWGAYPENDKKNIVSGSGFVHNSFMLEKAEKTIVRGPFYPFPRSLVHLQSTMLPKPAWFMTNNNAIELNKRVAMFTINGDIKQMPGVFAAAMKG